MTFTKPAIGVWDEAEMREIIPEPAPTLRRSQAGRVRETINALNRERAKTARHELTGGGSASVIYAPEATSHGNFIDASYRRILANPNWRARLQKAHTAGRQAGRTGPNEEVRRWRELDAATSSDALLMNVFCYPGVLRGGLRTLLGVQASAQIEFGVRSRAALSGDHTNTTEMDMRLGDLLVEAKLTEGDFQHAPMRLLERYTDLHEVFDTGALERTSRGVRSYQLLRGVLAAHAMESRFAVLCDGRRPDLVEDWFAVMRAVRSFELQSRLRLITWQEIAASVPAKLQVFLAEKYGIAP